MEIKGVGEWETSTPKVGLTTSSDHSVDVQHAVVVCRAVIVASSGDSSLLERCGRSVDIEDAISEGSGGIVASSGEGSM